MARGWRAIGTLEVASVSWPVACWIVQAMDGIDRSRYGHILTQATVMR